MRVVRSVVAVTMGVGLLGCGSPTSDPAMPDVTGKKLDVAKSDIKRAGFDGETEVLGGGTLGVVVDSNWVVCEQLPASGQPITEHPRLSVDRECNKSLAKSPETSSTTTSTTSPTTTSTTATPESAAVVVETTVDALLDRLNSKGMGGIKTGDKFRLMGELFEEDAWTTGATGDYFVYLRAKQGKDDLPVFVSRSDAVGWRNGTRVEMVVRAEERKISGEVSGGWLNALSVKTLST
jgi:hypothetical protein